MNARKKDSTYPVIDDFKTFNDEREVWTLPKLLGRRALGGRETGQRMYL